ncbi:tripartite tricarboxylate transporter substrate binding protein [Piscinibacter sakaiensis]|uniref:Putative exported protein n=1 Tax=Piscinibacter sakaiensis TaxID=1547922 RepID=A0A0K8P6R8_PISS1|nr:tripartite tricarboxylate transporter substrate binding protein [Piscinibacter sakaiensis]GAP38353.1 putative exported protein [Piscinibacter sakaiensis]
MKTLLAAATLLAAWTTASPAMASGYPDRELKLIVPFAAGQAADVGARIIASRLSKLLKQAIVIENRPGAGGNLALQIAAAAPADGYTLFVGSSATHGINPALYPPLRIDPLKDFTPVAYTGWTPIVLSVGNSVPYQTARELISSPAARSDRLQVAVANPGARVVLQQYNDLAKTQYQPIAYNASGAAFMDVVGGRVPVIFDSLPGTLPLLRAGNVRALALTSARRSVVLPDLPTLAESGLPGFDLAPWNVYFVPKGTPDKVVQTLHDAIQTVLADPGVQDTLRTAGYEPAPPMDVAAVARFVAAEAQKWGGLVRRSGMKPE